MTVKRIVSFTQERANRLLRYVAITRAYRAGAPVQVIEDKYGCSRSTVLRYARLAELPKRPKHFDTDVRAAVIADYKAGKMSVAQIAAAHDVSQAYVSKTAREEGISRYAPRPKRKKGPRPAEAERGQKAEKTARL
ncbi:hypothetical protein [Bradyrhizobium sp. AZCC 1620]|uniref:hypothetical protein n=1 Tax=Bradyrhizobium sp. AZCC 1620 TaxID=3117023 RepID=UPI002FF26C4C